MRVRLGYLSPKHCCFRSDCIWSILTRVRRASPLPIESLEMSEYQYYEFAAIDGPISDEGLRYARGCSRRAEVSRVRWQNTYHFGDFRGSIDTLMDFDAITPIVPPCCAGSKSCK